MGEIMFAVSPFALAVLILVMMRFVGVPFFPHSIYGKKFRRMPHYKRTEDGRKESVTQKWRNEMILKLLKEKKIEELELKFIGGELRNQKTIERALEEGFSVEVIFGPKVWNETSKKKFKKLMGDYPERFSVYLLDEKAPRHAYLIGPHYFLEDPHDYCTDYESALTIENAQESLISHFKTKFENMKLEAKKITIPDRDLENIEFCSCS